MALLPKPEPVKASKPRGKSKTSDGAKVIHEGTVEPIAGWVVKFLIVEDKAKASPRNPDGRFFVLPGPGVGAPEKRACHRLLLYRALADTVYGD